MAKSAQMAMSWLLKGKLDPSLIKATKETAKHIDGIKKSASLVGKQFKFLSGPIKALKVAMIGSVAGTIPAMMMLAKNTAASGDQFDKLSQKSGISAKTLSQWSHAANMSGVSTEQFGANILKLNQQMAAAAQGNKAAQLAFKRAGVSIRDSAGKMKTADQVLLEMSKTFKKMPEGIYKSDLAMAVFGKSGADMIPLLQGGSDAIQDLIKQSDELGMTFSNDEAKASAEFCDSLDVLKKSAKGLVNTIGKQLIPVITPLLQSMAKWISANRELISAKVGEFLEEFKAALPQIKNFLTGVFTGINNTATAMGGWMPLLQNSGKLFLAIKAIQMAVWLKGTTKAVLMLSKSFIKAIPVVIRFGVALLANPIGLVIAAIAGLVTAGYFLYKNWDKVVKFIKDMWKGIKNFFSNIFSNITGLFDTGFIKSILDLLKKFNPVTLVMNAIDGIFNYFKGISLIDEGSKLIKSFGDGIVKTWNSIKNAIIDLFTGWIPDWMKSGMKKVGIDVDAVRASAGLDGGSSGSGAIAAATATAVQAHHANGAIVRHRQIAEIGEDGAEAVIPLTKPARGRQLLMQSAKILGLRVTDKNDRGSESASQPQSSRFSGNNTGLLSTAITSFDKLVKPQLNGISDFTKKMTDVVSNVTNSLNHNDKNGLLSTAVTAFDKLFKPQLTGISDFTKKITDVVSNVTKSLNHNDKTGLLSTAINSLEKLVKPQVSGINDFAKKISNVVSNIKNPEKFDTNIFDNLLPKSGKSAIEEMMSGASQKNNIRTSFSPTFNPNITINCSSNVDEIEKRVKKILEKSQNDFAKQFSDFQYNKKRVGVF